MPEIHVLPKDISELIAAGEVIERPASVLKELTENAIDAGAKHITAEMKRGGVLYLRVTDDGCGIAPEQVRTAFQRHATSKISTAEDLESIFTLGFRGEALASVCAVARTEVLTRQRGAEYGTHYVTEGGEEILCEQSGCPEGTTLIVRDLFFNVPVRAGFLKKDTAEGNAAAAVFQKAALSHPEISFRLIRENKTEFVTPGDGKLYSAIYAVLGKDFARDLLPVQYSEPENGGISVDGFVMKPLYARPNRSHQLFFVNGRPVRSFTLMNAIEDAYKTLIMTGKFPACVLRVTVSPRIVDVNMHPTKAEVRFSDEKRIYSAVYFAVMGALEQNHLVYEFEMPQQSRPQRDWHAPVSGTDSNTPAPLIPAAVPHPFSDQAVQTARPEQPIDRKPVAEAVSQPINQNAAPVTPENMQPKPVDIQPKFADIQPHPVEIQPKPVEMQLKPVEIQPRPVEMQSRPAEISSQFSAEEIARMKRDSEPYDRHTISHLIPNHAAPAANPESTAQFVRQQTPVSPPAPLPAEPEAREAAISAIQREKITVIGELFDLYVLAQAGEQFVMIDKHAAHERILFERFRTRACKDMQTLLTPVRVLLTADEITALQEQAETLSGCGFAFDFSESPVIQMTGVPLSCLDLDLDQIAADLAENCAKSRLQPDAHLLDDMFHDLACKAAIKAGTHNTKEELQSLAVQVWTDDRIRHCPHGRPVLFLLSKYQIEKQFKRIQN